MRKAIFLIFLILCMSVVSAVEFVEVRSATDFDTFKDTLAIGINKNVLSEGETLIIEDVQYINAWCDDLNVEATILKDNQPFTGGSFNIGQIAYSSAYIKLRQDTTGFNEGDYVLEHRWYCTSQGVTVELGEDGYVDNNIKPNTKTFSIDSLSADLPEIQGCTQTCPVGFKLMNQNDASCYCEKSYDANDGVCDVGEPITTNDCDLQNNCLRNEVLVNGQCVDYCSIASCENNQNDEVPQLDDDSDIKIGLAIAVLILGFIGVFFIYPSFITATVIGLIMAFVTFLIQNGYILK